jgi:hypothetical protein
MKKPQAKKLKHYFLVILLASVSISCGVLTNKVANEAFLKEHPTYTIVSSATGEGWDGVGYHHFSYKKPNDERIYKEIWCFEQQEDGAWKVTQRWTPENLNE